MSLRTTIHQAVSTLFTAIDDLATTITYRASAGVQYDPTTGSIMRNDTEYPIPCALLEYTKTEVAREPILAGDRRLICQAASLPREPASEDQVIISSQVWRVIKWSADPATATYTIQLRKG